MRYRLEITGRAGWFVPAFEAEMPDDQPEDVVRTRMVGAMNAFGPRYVADPELGEGYKLRELIPTCRVCTTTKPRR